MLTRVRAWLRSFSTGYWLALGFFILSFGLFYLWNLSALSQRRLSPAEAAARANTASLHALLNNAVGLPQKILQLTAQKLGYHGAFSLRLSSVIIAALILLSMFWLMRTWFGLTAGLAAALIFATTPMVVLLARSATSGVLLLAPAVVLAAYVRLTRREYKPNWPWLVLIVVAASSLYTPGMLWVVAATAFFTRRRLIEQVKKVSLRYRILSGVLAVLLLAPLAWSLAKTPSLYHDWLLIPQHWNRPLALAKSAGWSALALVWRTPQPNDLIINRLPILDGVQLCLIFFGGYVMWTRARRTMLGILAIIVFSIIAAAINNNVLLLALGLPGLAVLVGGGLRYLYAEWRSVFPRNPIPLGFAWALIIAVVGLQMAYGLRYSLIAWPHAPATKQTYVLK